MRGEYISKAECFGHADGMTDQRELYTGEVDDDLPHASDCAHWAGETCDCVTHMDTCDCRFTGDQADASDCELHGLHRITTRVAVANVAEWNKGETCPF